MCVKYTLCGFLEVCVQYLICVLPGVQSVQNMFFVQCVFFVHDVCCSATLAPINIPSSGLDTARHLHLHLLPHHLRQHQHHLDLDLDLDYLLPHHLRQHNHHLDLDLDHVVPHHLHQLHYNLALDLKRTVINSNACFTSVMAYYVCFLK